MIVLSTSKNAAAVGSGGVASDDSTSAAAAAASPARADRLRRSVLRRRRGRPGRCHRNPRAGVRRCARLDGVTAHLAELLSHAAAEAADRVALIEAGSGRRVTWAELDDEADRVAHGFAEMGLVAGYRVVIALANRTEFVASYLGTLRAGLVAVPVNPRAATGELVRLLADCGARAVLADVATVTTVRQAVAGLDEALRGSDEEVRRSTAVPRVVVVGESAGAGETPYDDLIGRAWRRDARRRRHRAPGGAALHQRDLRAAAGGDADPPRAAGEHRAGRPGRAVDAAARRRGLRGAAAVPRLRPQRRARAGAAPAGAAGARRRLRHGGLAGDHRGRGGQRAAGRAAGVRLLGGRPRPARAAQRRAAGAVRLRTALGRAGAQLHRAHRASTCTRATA